MKMRWRLKASMLYRNRVYVVLQMLRRRALACHMAVTDPLTCGLFQARCAGAIDRRGNNLETWESM